MPFQIFLGTHNAHKIEEFQSLLNFNPRKIEIVVSRIHSLGSVPEVKETENTFIGNARLKAQAYFQVAQKNFNSLNNNWFILADDSGLEVDALRGKPGVLSARYASNKATGHENNMKLLRELENVPVPLRTARFICTLILLNAQGIETNFTGVCEGNIALSLKNPQGFGYDPLFIPQGYSSTFTELGQSIKNKISHRARAIQKLREYLLELSFKA